MPSSIDRHSEGPADNGPFRLRALANAERGVAMVGPCGPGTRQRLEGAQAGVHKNDSAGVDGGVVASPNLFAGQAAGASPVRLPG